MYVVEVIVADTSTFKNRALAFAFNASPYIATTWAGPEAAQSFLRTSGWRWGFGTFAIILPFVAAPIFIILYRNQKKAEEQGLWVHKPSGRTLMESLKYHIIDYDGTPLTFWFADSVCS
jgi:MFS family permease